MVLGLICSTYQSFRVLRRPGRFVQEYVQSASHARALRAGAYHSITLLSPLPQAAWGAAITDGVAASAGWLDFVPPMQPEPVRFPRRGLDQRFAVLLMQSSYRAVDALDFIPMVCGLSPVVLSTVGMMTPSIHLVCVRTS